jgi:hypothetical protein
VKSILLSLSFLLIGLQALRASGDTPPIPVEVTDKSAEGTEAFAFQVREKLRASQTFKLVISDSQARIHLAMLIDRYPDNPDLLIISAVWTVESAGFDTGTLMKHALSVVGPKRQEEEVNQILAVTEESYRQIANLAPAIYGQATRALCRADNGENGRLERPA